MRITSTHLIWAALACTSLCETNTLPVVDLGYELHQALAYNATTDVYKFLNIRYAQSPVGNLRFRAPVAPLTDRDQVQNGSVTRTCPQGVPHWQAKAFWPIERILLGGEFTLASWESSIAAAKAPKLDFNYASTEDCLFLDVQVSAKAFQNASTGGAPVLVWIHGGGYNFGSKINSPLPSYHPDGLFLQSAKTSEEGLVFVALNYRLGALGFLSGPKVQKNGDLNAGLLDQRLALEWVQNNIHLFGGSADRVTVMGESAGGGSILLQAAAYGGKNGSAPFQQVILQSPAIAPPISAKDESVYDGFLSQLGVSTLAQARAVSSREIIRANALHVSASNQTSYTYGPIVDGVFSPAEVSQLYLDGSFDKSIKVFSAHNYFEGSFFYDPNVTTNAQFRRWIESSMPGLSTLNVDHAATVLYPPVFDGSLGYTDDATRQMVLWAEAVINCNWILSNTAFNGSSFAYEFAVSPGIHSEDQKYTFNDFLIPAVVPSAQSTLQHAIVTFVTSGVPMLESQQLNATWPQWGSDRTLVSIGSDGSAMAKSSIHQTRCAWWNQGRFGL